MMQNHRTRFLVCLVLAGMALGLPVRPQEQESNKIGQILITGNQNINTDTIQNAVTSKVGDEYTQQTIDNDVAAIKTLGYFSGVVARRQIEPSGLKVIFEVVEHPKVTTITITGSDPIPQAKIIEKMKTKIGLVLNELTLRQDLDTIQSIFADEGYFAYIAGEPPIDEKGALTIPLMVNKVGKVLITGNKKTRPWVFTREMKTQPGKYLNLKTLNEDIFTVYGLDILEDIKQYQITPGAQPGTADVTLPVVEKKTGQVSAGVGYSSGQKLVGQIRLSDTNFRGKAQGVNVLWERSASGGVGGNSSFELGFVEPWLDRHRTSLSVNAYNKIQYRFSSGVFGGGSIVTDQTYNERRKGGDLTLGRPFGNNFRVFLSGRFENVDTDPSLLSGAGDLASVVQRGDVMGLSTRLEHDTRDVKVDPSIGVFNSLAVEFGRVNSTRYGPSPTFNPIPFDGAFNKVSLDLRAYVPLKGGRKKLPTDKRLTLAMRSRVGLASGTLPFFENFFAGGADTLRGYREDRFYGKQMWLNTAELRIPISSGFQAVVFSDYGDAWDANPIFKVGTLVQHTKFVGNWSGGVGMGFATPMGFIRLDYGVGKEGARTHFNIGQSF